jgi:hypothetical protein
MPSFQISTAHVMYDLENKELASLLLYPYFIMIITPAGAGPEKIGAT